MNYLSLNQNQGIQYLNGYVSQEETNNKVTITYYFQKKKKKKKLSLMKLTLKLFLQMLNYGLKSKLLSK